MLSKLALWLMGGVVLSCYLVPYYILDTVTTWHGAFLFWSLAGLAVIGLNIVATAGFREDSE